MDRDIKLFVESIKKNTGIDLTVFNAQGKPLVGSFSKDELAPTNFSGVFNDQASNNTYFYINRKGSKYICRLEGVSSQQNAFAFLICQIAGKADNKYPTAIEFLGDLITNQVDVNQIEYYCKQFSILNKPLFVMAVSCKGNNMQEVVDFLSNYNGDGKDIVLPLQDDSCLLIKYLDDVLGEYFSPSDYAEMLCRSMYEEAGIDIQIGIGGRVNGIKELSISASQAMTAVDMMGSIKSLSKVHTYKEFTLSKILEELPKNRQIDYVKSLLDSGAKQIFDDAESLETAQAFLDNDLNISETARVLYIHRNTLNYRLDKIQNFTGFDIRKFSDAVTFKIIALLYKHIK